ncbi:hypothetical protein TRFO_22822 [Tritrichomonas foetus]|uniref:Uncharacterized protein n=1 Tax=Tritrichomonas foetus TaxID=1144522 RepID=A0A1J4KCB0_9EUKA|nr:hypothetical protein TRFO_22822 [Tritrichomonas foetus]|eukprot:OHT08568.1 hypothetical protein TRFO_22822 [Tritrichomonas foetus]
MDSEHNYSRSPSVASSRSPSYRGRSGCQNHQIMEATYDVINGLNDDLETLSQDNLKLRSIVDELESHLSAITKALNEDLTTVEEVNKQLQESNDALIAEIERRNELIEFVKPMLLQCIEMNPSAFQDDPDLSKLLTKVTGNSGHPYSISMDPLLNKILPGIEYFKDVKTNNDFITRCKIIQNEIARLEKECPTLPIFETEYEKANVAVLRKHLQSIQSNNDVISIDYGERIKELNREKSDLLEERRKLIDAQINSRSEYSFSIKPSTIVHKSPMKDNYSPIRKRTTKASPLRF